jgi:hypothetical protein
MADLSSTHLIRHFSYCHLAPLGKGRVAIEAVEHLKPPVCATAKFAPVMPASAATQSVAENRWLTFGNPGNGILRPETLGYSWPQSPTKTAKWSSQT